MQDETEKFLSTKEDVLNNIGVLKFNLEQCTEMGMQDPESALYNRIETLRDYVKEIDSYDALEEAVSQAKTIEMEIDNWLVLQGQLSIGLSWPTF